MHAQVLVKIWRKVVLLANYNSYEVDLNRFFLCAKALYPFNVSPCLNSDILDTHS